MSALIWDIQEFESLSSTQNKAIEAAGADAPAGTVIHALVQQGGRGRYDRKWESLDGNLFLSLILRPEARADALGGLSLLSGVAIARAVRSALDGCAALALKWPNDVMLDGRKCAGILIETDLATDGALNWAVIGLGVNLKCAPNAEASALAEFREEELDLYAFRDELLSHFKKLYSQWTSGGIEPIKEAWLAFGYAPGTEMSIKLPSGAVQGAFAGLDEGGNLLLDMPDGETRVFTAGDVFVKV